jgi:hypothetical protein
MTAPTPDATRADTAAILRAVADLIETQPSIPVPAANVSFHVRGDGTPATMAAIAAALPCQWQAEINRSGGYEWLSINSGSIAVLHGAQVSVSAPAADACTAAGAKTVTVWQPAAALARLLGTSTLGEVA